MERTNYEFYVANRVYLGESIGKIFKDLFEIYGEQCPSRATIYRYAVKSRKERHLSCDNASISANIGRPISISTEENINLIDGIIQMDRYLSVRQIETISGINREAVRGILKDQLNHRFICSAWVPHLLSEDNKKLRVGGAKSILNYLSNFPERNRLYAVQDQTRLKTKLGWNLMKNDQPL